MSLEERKAELKAALENMPESYPDFVSGVLRDTETEEKAQALIDFIKEGKFSLDPTSSVLVKELELEGIFPDENGDYNLIEILDDDEYIRRFGSLDNCD